MRDGRASLKSLVSVPAELLLVVAGAVWAVAGVNIERIGVGALAHVAFIGWAVAGACVVFALFHALVFQKLVRKHAARIGGYGGAHTAVWRFFDAKGYVVMACMMGAGIGLRAAGVLPDWFVASFYSGLGAAMLVASGTFVARYLRARLRSDGSAGRG